MSKHCVTAVRLELRLARSANSCSVTSLLQDRGIVPCMKRRLEVALCLTVSPFVLRLVCNQAFRPRKPQLGLCAKGETRAVCAEQFNVYSRVLLQLVKSKKCQPLPPIVVSFHALHSSLQYANRNQMRSALQNGQEKTEQATGA